MSYVDPISNGLDPALFHYVIPKVLVATFVGGLIGFNRERLGKPAGIKTNILLCVGSALFTCSSLLITGSGEHADVARIVAQIVPGIGFLGAGTIFRAGDKTYGLTSAALIWVAASLGVLIGLGAYLLSALLSLGMVITIPFLTWFERRYFRNE